MAEKCEHLSGLKPADFPPPQPPDACAECLEEGTRWVSLRECKECGHVGCCDSSPRKHATQHYRRTQHPVMRSVMPGDTWDWCYVHKQTGDLSAA
jgi:CPA1 family monovalent cation:H+ antiporter